jgi:hypothetical protein
MRSGSWWIALTLAGALGGCVVDPGDPGDPEAPRGDVSFRYIILEQARPEPLAISCAEAGVLAIRFAVGQDFDGDGVLSRAEEVEARQGVCEDGALDFNGNITERELPSWGPRSFFSGAYDLFSVELIDAVGDPVEWVTADGGAFATRFSFGGGLELLAHVESVVPFAGDEFQIGNELQIYVR